MRTIFAIAEYGRSRNSICRILCISIYQKELLNQKTEIDCQAQSRNRRAMELMQAVYFLSRSRTRVAEKLSFYAIFSQK